MYFIYENNKSMAPAIRASITETFGFEPICINSALVSAQNRQRLYWVGKRNEDGSYSKVDVEHPTDRGIVLRDILESGENLSSNEKSYALATVGDCKTLQKAIPQLVDKYGYLPEQFNAYNLTEIEDKSPTLSTGSMVTSSCATTRFEKCNEPIRIGDIGSTAQAHRVYSCDAKSVTINAGGGGQGGKTGLYATPIKVGEVGKGGQGNRIYSVDGKSVSQTATSGGIGSNSGLYACPCTGFEENVYLVANGLITIKYKQYPIKLEDGLYTIRKLTVKECCRLQTVPEWYVFPVSNSQAYKMLGNGWTVEVIVHLIKSALEQGD